MRYCGIDLHSNNSVVVVTDETDKVLVSRRCPNELSTILALLAPHRELTSVAVESTRHEDFFSGHPGESRGPVNQAGFRLSPEWTKLQLAGSIMTFKPADSAIN